MTRITDNEIERHLIEGTNEKELREFLGDDVYDALRAEAVATGDFRPDPTQEFLGFGGDDKPAAYILPGIMGSKLSAQDDGDGDLIWFDPVDIRRGGVAKLKFGAEPHPVFASGTFWSAYGILRLRLRALGYQARFLPYDWRKSIPDLGKELLSQVKGNGGNGAVLVAHSMGGLVARQIASLDTGNIIKRVVTIGTPNYGSYSPVQVFRVASDMLNKIGWLDEEHTPNQIAKLYLRHFPGLVEMMPDPALRPAEAYFDPAYWPSGGARPNNKTLSDALTAKSDLPAPDSRFRQIIGYGQNTVVAATKTDSELTYRYSSHGDGTVPVDLAQVDNVPQYFVEATHAGMLQRKDVAKAVHELIEDGVTSAVSNREPISGLTSEATIEQRTDEEIRKANRALPRPENPDVHDILSEFLPTPPPISRDYSRDTAVSGETSANLDSNGFDGGLDMSRKVGGYPLSVLLQASENWRGEVKTTAYETAGQHARETDHRMQKYAARKLQQLRTIVEETPKQRVLPDRLQEIVATGEDNPTDAISALLNERVMGEAEEFLSVLYLKRAAIVSKSVGRIIRRNSEIGFGTGFLVAGDVLITNHHVLSSETAASNAAVQFDFEINYRNREMRPVRFELRPDLLFYANNRLDFALVAVEQTSSESGRPLEDFGYLPLDGGEGKITIGKPINVIQHPNAEQKQAVFREAMLQDLPANELDPDAQFTGSPSDIAAHYSADTKPGSSGSPVFSDAWEVIALHHSGVAVIKDGEFQMKDGSFKHPNRILDDNDVYWPANEGIRISRITRHLEDLLGNDTYTLSASARDRIQAVLHAGKYANKYGHFNRPMPRPVLVQFEDVGGSGDEPQQALATESVASGAGSNVREFEGLLSVIRDAISRLGGSTPVTPGLRSGGAITIDSSGVARGSGGLVVTYRGDANSPYGRSATNNRRPFNSIVLHHNAANLSTDWLIQYQIEGDSARGGHFGYHFYIDPNGGIFQGAPMGKRTNHVKPPNHSKRKNFGRIASNNSSIGITCVKAGPNYNPTAAQIESQDKLVAALASAYGIPLTNVFGHGEIQSDRNSREGASQAEKFRGAGGAVSGAEAIGINDDMDDTALESVLDPVEHFVGIGRNMPMAGFPVEDDDDLSVEAMPEGIAPVQTYGIQPAGAETLGTRLVYTNAAATRNKPCTPNLESRLTQAVDAVYGPGYTINIYSGGQDRKGFGNRRVGSIRHDDYGQGGRGADVYLIDPSGAKVRGIELAKLGQYWLAAGFGCVGHEMGGGGIHLDEWVPPPSGGGRFWTYAASDSQPWGAQARAMLVRGAAGTYP